MIYRLRDFPLLTTHPAWLEFVERACRACGRGPAAVGYLNGLWGNPNVLGLVGEENAYPVALFVCELPTPMMLCPMITLAYNEGSKELRARMFCWLARWVRAAGHDTVSMINTSGHTDTVYERALRPLGTIEGQATLLKVKLRQEGEPGAEVLTSGGVGLAA